MSWARSTRRDRLPSDWPARRREVLARAGGRCQAIMSDGTRCRDRANQCDHIIAGDNHAPSNLQALCAWHHGRKTAAEGAAARALNPKATRKRGTETHPGAL